MTRRAQLRIAVSQRRARSGGPALQTESLAAQIDQTAGRADVMLFPEMALTGYQWTPEAVAVAAAMAAADPWVDVIGQAARRAGVVVAVGFPERAGQTVYNSVAVLDTDGTLAGIYRKTHLFADEGASFQPGSRLDPIRTSVGVLGMLICYDVEFPEAARTLAARGAEVLVVATANMHPYGSYHEVFMRARAMENGVALAIANYVGSDGVFDYLGRSGIVSGAGELMAIASRNRAETMVATVELQPPTDRNLAYADKLRPSLYLTGHEVGRGETDAGMPVPTGSA